ncbi:condensation domain-containing protein, partial [Candidatus Nitrosotalea sp. FS]|uniref:condensation domain-containing protein n=1 Tax=Candidatus Nitrosotalea sp. FS TaxID=2341021 RepID=UPI002108099D
MGEIEAVLGRHPGVEQAVVIVRGVEGKAGEKRLLGYVIGQPGAGELGEEGLRGYLQERLPEYMVPGRIMQVKSWPLSSNGKIDRKALPEIEREGKKGRGGERREGIEELLGGIWEQVLGVREVGAEENFFQLGGHSLLATQVMSRIGEVYGREFSIRLLFERPTVRGLGEGIREELASGEGLRLPELKRREGDRREAPLSYAQERVWFLYQLEPENSFYNVALAVRMQGRLEVRALERSLQEMVRRHEVLRTGFVVMEGKPRQVIQPAGEVKMELPVVDVRHLRGEEREEEVRRRMGEEARRPFVLEQGGLLRSVLLRVGEEEHVGMFTLHHIISDGWSLGVLVGELSELYAAEVEGRKAELGELGIQYGDYAVWQRGWLEGEELERQLGYWREELAELPVVELRGDRRRPAVQSYCGASVQVELGEELSAGVRELCRGEGVTEFMMLLAGFAVLLARYSGQTDVVVGT